MFTNKFCDWFVCNFRRAFLCKFLKSCLHSCICSSWLVYFSLAFVVLFSLLSSFTVCHAIIACLILLIWFCMYSVYILAISFGAFLSFRALILLVFLLLYLKAVFMSACRILTANVAHATLGLVLSLVDMHSSAASRWALTESSYSLFGVCVSDLFGGASYLFLSVIVYVSLISLLLSSDQS